MHVLVINDDGPPSNQSSPYVHAFIQTLQNAGHIVSVILPHQQRSWIGKAHFVGQLARPTYFRPGTLHRDDGLTHDQPLPNGSTEEEWILIDGSPATCAQLGLFHFFVDRPPIDLVVSGPNYGRNSTALFALSSGTIGGAMEAATFRKRAIALSFAFSSREHVPEIIAEACQHSVKVIEYISNHWGIGVDLYSINVPLTKGIKDSKIYVTEALENTWATGSSFVEVPCHGNRSGNQYADDPTTSEKVIREHDVTSSKIDDVVSTRMHAANNSGRAFKWAPNFADVQKSIDNAAPGNDGWAVSKGYTSVTPLKASFKHASNVSYGELKLDTMVTNESVQAAELQILIGADDYLLPILRNALESLLPDGSFSYFSSISECSVPTDKVFQLLPYESIDFGHLLENPYTSLANSYIIRKALIRKHYLWQTVNTWLVKHPHDTRLAGHVPLTEVFELDYAEFLDDSLVECWDLRASFDRQVREGVSEWWILKPGMSDRGQGLRLFRTMSDLQEIFDSWETDESDDVFDDMGECIDQSANTMTSQLRHFAVQKYIGDPLLLAQYDYRKFHIRTYVLALGALKVYVFREMLALFALCPYIFPGEAENGLSIDSRIHLTNTCLQDGETAQNSVQSFWDLSGSLSSPGQGDWKDDVFTQIKGATSALFEAAAREQMVHFQALPNAFEVFGVDWVVDASSNVWLLEVNAFPDFKQSGHQHKNIVRDLWHDSLRLAMGEFFELSEAKIAGQVSDNMVKVLDIDLGR